MYQAHYTSNFEQLILRSENTLGAAVMLILTWIAASDGMIDEAERNHLSEISVAPKHGHDVQPLIEVVRVRDLAAIQLASEIVRHHFQGKKARLFLEMAIGIAIADGYLLPTENHILRFLADLVGVDRAGLNRIFVEVTGRDIPEPTDPSLSSYWKARNDKNRQTRSGSSASNEQGQETRRDQKAITAYAILGLDNGATLDDIKRAYRRLAQIHHPDRFTSLGGESVAAATSTFQRIKDAYEYLVKNA